MVAMVEDVKKWRHYLLGHHFVILTDQKSLKEILTQVIQTLAQHNYLTMLLGYDYSIVYKAKKDNVVADLLLRQHDNYFCYLTYSMLHFSFVDKIKEEYSIVTALLKRLDDFKVGHPL